MIYPYLPQGGGAESAYLPILLITVFFALETSCFAKLSSSL